MIKFFKKIKRFLFKIKSKAFIYLSNFFISDDKINIELIVFGFQKSGTTAIANLIAINTNKTITIDPPILWAGISNVLLKKTSLKEVIYNNKVIFTTQILKEPSLTFIADDVLKLFPNSKFVFIIRNPFENIRSILNRLSLKGDYNDLPKEIFDKINDNWKPLIKGELYGIRDKSYIEVLATLWVKAANVYLKNPDIYILIKYEDFISDKEKIIDSVTQDLGFIKVNSINKYKDKQFQPKGENVDLLNFFGKNNYLKIETICSNYYDKFND